MRLVTRADFDGLVCGALLKSKGIVDEFAFVHPRDLQAGLVAVSANDILANVAYAPGCGMWFDHHSSEMQRVPDARVDGLVKLAPSCARVIWEYYGGDEGFSGKFQELLDAVDKVDSGMLSFEEVSNPTGWVLLGLIMDPRSGLQNVSGFRIGGYELVLLLMDVCVSHSIDEILQMPDIKERVERFFSQEAAYKEMLAQCSRPYGNVLVTDLRAVGTPVVGSRFTVYAMYPEINVSIQVMWGFKQKRVILAVGHSILNRTCPVDIGNLMLQYGGGGHARVGTCQVLAVEADAVIASLISTLREGSPLHTE